MDHPSQTAFVFDGSYDGFLTIVYGHYYEKWRPADIVADGDFQQRLETDYVFVETDPEKARKVLDAISERISLEAAENCYAAFLAEDPRVYMAVYQYIVLGFSLGKDVDNHKHIGQVLTVQKTAKSVLNDAHLHKEFCRFTETKTGVFYADISPKYNVLTLMAEHFTDRFMNFAWVIHDVKRGYALLYDGKECVLTLAPKDAKVELSDTEEHYQALWSGFFNSITIESRKNARLQQQLMPLRFRKHVTEHKRRGRERL